MGFRKGKVFILSIILLSGCAYRGPSTPVINEWDLYNAYVRIETNRTTQKEVYQWLGRPYLKTRDNLGREKWIYKTTSPFSSQARLDVTFDEDGRVILYFFEGEGNEKERPLP